MIDILTTIVILVVGLVLVVSIIWNRLVPHLGPCLMTASASVQFPLTKGIQLELNAVGTPKRVIIKCAKSIGFYNGDISVINGNAEIAHYTLPVLPEYRNKPLGFHNEDIPRKTDTIIMRLVSYNAESPLMLNLNLKQNVQNPKLRQALDVSSEETIEIMVRG